MTTEPRSAPRRTWPVRPRRHLAGALAGLTVSFGLGVYLSLPLLRPPAAPPIEVPSSEAGASDPAPRMSPSSLLYLPTPAAVVPRPEAAGRAGGGPRSALLGGEPPTFPSRAASAIRTALHRLSGSASPSAAASTGAVLAPAGPLTGARAEGLLDGLKAASRALLGSRAAAVQRRDASGRSSLRSLPAAASAGLPARGGPIGSAGSALALAASPTPGSSVGPQGAEPSGAIGLAASPQNPPSAGSVAASASAPESLYARLSTQNKNKLSSIWDQASGDGSVANAALSGAEAAGTSQCPPPETVSAAQQLAANNAAMPQMIQDYGAGEAAATWSMAPWFNLSQRLRTSSGLLLRDRHGDAVHMESISPSPSGRAPEAVIQDIASRSFTVAYAWCRQYGFWPVRDGSLLQPGMSPGAPSVYWSGPSAPQEAASSWPCSLKAAADWLEATYDQLSPTYALYGSVQPNWNGLMVVSAMPKSRGLFILDPNAAYPDDVHYLSADSFSACGASRDPFARWFAGRFFSSGSACTTTAPKCTEPVPPAFTVVPGGKPVAKVTGGPAPVGAELQSCPRVGWPARVKPGNGYISADPGWGCWYSADGQSGPPPLNGDPNAYQLPSECGGGVGVGVYDRMGNWAPLSHSRADYPDACTNEKLAIPCSGLEYDSSNPTLTSAPWSCGGHWSPALGFWSQGLDEPIVR